MSVSAAPWRGLFGARAATGTGRHRAAHQVEQATWNPGRAELRLASRPPAAPDVVLRTATPDPLLHLARERISATTLAHAPLRLDGHVVGSVAAHRPPGDDHDISWVVHVHPGTDVPESAITGTIENVRIHIGL